MSDESAGDRRLMIVAVLASFVAFLDGSVVTLALPAIGADFGGGLRLQQWVFDGYLLLLGALILLAGAVSDSIGRLRVLRGGIVVFGLGSMLCAVAPNGAVLVAARCLQGLGAAFLVPSSLAMINGRFTGDRQAKAIGRWTGWTGTAFVVGPVLGGVLVDTVGWRWIFAINLLPLAVTFFLSTRLTRDDVVRPARPGGIDVVGAVLTITGLTGVVAGLIEQQRLGMTSPLVLSALIVGVLCLVAFPWWEARAENPMMPLHLFASRNFAVGNAATVFLYAGLSLSTLVVTLFFTGDGRAVGDLGRAGNAGDADLVDLAGRPLRRAGGSVRPAVIHGGRSAGIRGGISVDAAGAQRFQLLATAAARFGAVRGGAGGDGVAVDRGRAGVRPDRRRIRVGDRRRGRSTSPASGAE